MILGQWRTSSQFALISCRSQVGIQYTGAAVNTARAFGPSVVTRDFHGSHWIYWVGPGLGAVLAAALHKLMRAIHFYELNPGADDTHNEPSRETQQLQSRSSA